MFGGSIQAAADSPELREAIVAVFHRLTNLANPRLVPVHYTDLDVEGSSPHSIEKDQAAQGGGQLGGGGIGRGDPVINRCRGTTLNSYQNCLDMRSTLQTRLGQVACNVFQTHRNSSR